MKLQEAIQKAIKGGWKDWGWSNNEHTEFNTAIFLDPLFWQSLGKSLGWGQEISEGEHEWGKRICLHCGVDTAYQPPRESGCNHAHYPEACKVCSEKGATWRDKAESFFRHVMSGNSIESFFETL